VRGPDTLTATASSSWAPNDGTTVTITTTVTDGLGAAYNGVNLTYVKSGSAALSSTTAVTAISGGAAITVGDAVAESTTVIIDAPALTVPAVNVNVNFLAATADEDGDGLTNTQEYVLGTDPFKVDSDGDGASDFHENALGTDPNNIAVFPVVTGMIWDNVTTGVWDQSYWGN